MEKRNQFPTWLIVLLIMSWPLTLAAKTGAASQTLKGRVVDQISQETLPGASVIINASNFEQSVSTDLNGNFKFNNVPLGRYSVKVVFLGYKESVIPNVTVIAGKETFLAIELIENITEMKGVVITGNVEKNKPINEMSAVSTRTFSVEETQKFAAAVNDPGRMATSFAGVVGGPDGNNIISIRGNAPNALLWRMEGVEIPNPNHFSSVGTSGGGISILSAQLLSNSDFSTGAFAAEYGNALGGVFDLKLRTGNNEKREYTFQAGFLGIDAAAEGPLKKGYDGSFLVNYRYSTLGLLSKIGVPIGDGVTIFQDLSFNLSLPTNKMGRFSIFGFGGNSFQNVDAEKDSIVWEENPDKQFGSKFSSNTGAIGLTHTLLFTNASYLKTIVLLSGTENTSSYGQLDKKYAEIPQARNQHVQGKITLSSTYTKKVNARNNVRAGLIVNNVFFNLKQSDVLGSDVMTDRIKVQGSTYLYQGFFQWTHRLGQKLTMNGGLNAMGLALNQSFSLGPRASLKYEITPRQNLSFGYGLHSQQQPLGSYFTEVKNSQGLIIQPNKDLDFSKANHFVLGYDVNLNSFTHIKTEIYYQGLFDIPIAQDTANRFSMVNSIDGFQTDHLNNNGLGINKGIELTLERFLHRNLYFLLSTSLFDAKFKASNNQWYNTRFNTNYAITFTGGKEWTLSERRKNRVIGFNVKTLWVGGMRYNNIDLEKSIAQGEQVEDNISAYEHKIPDYFRTDIRISSKRNFERVTTTFALDIQNVSARKNVGGQYFEPLTGKVKYWYQAPLIPIISYKIEF